MACLLFSLMAAAVFTQAAPAINSLAITGAGLLQCSGNVIEASFTPTAYDAGNSTVGSFTATVYITTSNGAVAPQSANLTSGSGYTFYLAVGSETMSYAEVYVVSGSAQSGTVTIYCDGRVVFGANGEDHRMNYANGDLINVLYAATDSQGGVKVYSVDANSKGVFEGRFAYTLFEPYLDNPPAVNTFLGQVDYSRLYALTSGEFQIIVDDPIESKTYTTIFSAFPVSGIYFR